MIGTDTPRFCTFSDEKVTTDKTCAATNHLNLSSCIYPIVHTTKSPHPHTHPHNTTIMAPPALTADEIDDVLYFTRVNEVEDLKTTIAELAQKYQCETKEVVEAAIDPESGNGTLHYCAANGLAGKKRLRSLQP